MRDLREPGFPHTPSLAPRFQGGVRGEPGFKEGSEGNLSFKEGSEGNLGSPEGSPDILINVINNKYIIYYKLYIYLL